jgi:hypothetical protein
MKYMIHWLLLLFIFETCTKIWLYSWFIFEISILYSVQIAWMSQKVSSAHGWRLGWYNFSPVLRVYFTVYAMCFPCLNQPWFSNSLWYFVPSLHELEIWNLMDDPWDMISRWSAHCICCVLRTISTSAVTHGTINTCMLWTCSALFHE